MKVRVYLGMDSKCSFLFENIDKVKDGTDGISYEDNKLVLLRKVSKVERESIRDGTTGDRDIANVKRDFLETVAVFNHWRFWKVVDEETKSTEDGPVKINEKVRTLYLVLQTLEGKDSPVEYIASEDVFVLHLRGGYTTTISNAFVEDFLTRPKKYRKKTYIEKMAEEKHLGI